MPELASCFESAGFTEVKTIRSSGNVVFSSRMKSIAQIERKAEAAMTKYLGRTFYTIVRSQDELRKLLDADPFTKFDLPEDGKCVVTFMREPRKPACPLPIERDGAKMLAAIGREVFSVYIPGPRGPVFMALIEKTFGSDVTTRTWETVRKCTKCE